MRYLSYAEVQESNNPRYFHRSLDSNCRAGSSAARLKQSRAQRTKFHAQVVVILPVIFVLLSLSARGFSQTADATSHLKKPLIYQIGNVVHIHAEGERPLLRALDALREK